MNTVFPLARLLGRTLSEVKRIPGDFRLPLNLPGPILRAHLWKSYIRNLTGNPIATEGKEVLATRNRFGIGKLLGSPRLLPLGQGEQTTRQSPILSGVSWAGVLLCSR